MSEFFWIVWVLWKYLPPHQFSKDARNIRLASICFQECLIWFRSGDLVCQEKRFYMWWFVEFGDVSHASVDINPSTIHCFGNFWITSWSTWTWLEFLGHFREFLPFLDPLLTNCRVVSSTRTHTSPMGPWDHSASRSQVRFPRQPWQPFGDCASCCGGQDWWRV